MIKTEIREKLLSLEADNYRKYNETLLSSKSKIIGIKLGAVRKIAKELSKSDWRTYVESLDDGDYFEEKLVAGISIFYSDADIYEKIKYSKKFTPFVDGWAVCDSVYMTPKLKNNEKKPFHDYAVECAFTEDEFTARVGLVSLLHSFTEDEYIDEIFEIINKIHFVGEYDRLAASWLMAECMAKCPERTKKLMKLCTVENKVYNKGITKMRESFRVSDEMKDILKTMVRK